PARPRRSSPPPAIWPTSISRKPSMKRWCRSWMACRSDREAVIRTASEPALADEDGVARRQRGAERHHIARRSARIGVGQRDHVALGARREAAGDRDRALDRHVRHIRILARGLDLAENEERPVGFDFDSNRRLADIALAQARRNL